MSGFTEFKEVTTVRVTLLHHQGLSAEKLPRPWLQNTRNMPVFSQYFVHKPGLQRTYRSVAKGALAWLFSGRPPGGPLPPEFSERC
jgi:hypothetical protein